MAKYDVAIIGGGILGTSISYWISSLYNAKICVIEKEPEVAMHASSRNTGVLHSPFYLDPVKKKILAKSAFISHALWKTLAAQKKLPWKNVGTLEVALDENQHKTLEKYMKWGTENGISQNDIELLDSNDVSKREPNVRCHSAVFCKTDVGVDYGAFTREIKDESQRNGTQFLLKHNVKSIDSKEKESTIKFQDNTELTSKLIINCAGGNSLDIAKMVGIAEEYSDLHFRGEYWIADDQYADLVKTNVYSVAKLPNFPFLDPHWIRRADGTTEIGPNAVPVMSAETYSGYLGEASTSLSKIAEIVTGNARKLLLNPDFISLISKEWLSSISKTVMIERVQQFIPKIRSNFFNKRGTAGIRTPLITPEGTFLPDVLEIEGVNSFHVLNYNSPGATGAPAYSAYVVKRLQEKGLLNNATQKKSSIWNFEEIIAKLNILSA
ncbi:MAG TPA: FAD-dependent oxidoreductase [Nitrosopumilaceae archaeon]|nr:FAD-dependent oxidoreductase [Nitrosopumilaceae archaeon]